jgi:phage gp29-like protein
MAVSNRQKFTFRNNLEAWYIVSQRLPNPDVVLRKRNASITLYRQLLSDAHLTACLESRQAKTSSNEWEIQQNDCPVRVYKAIEKWFFSLIERKIDTGDLSKIELIDNLLEVSYYGYQPTELIWDYMYGMWLPVRVIPKPPEWFQWFVRDDGIPEIRFMSNTNPVDGEPMPDEFTMVCPRVKPTYENPYGRGTASRCFWPVVFKRAGTEFWMNFLERFGTPWVKGKIQSSTQEDLDNFAAELRQLVQDAVVVVNEGKDVELMETGQGQGRISEGFRTSVDFWDSQMSKTILGHTLSTDTKDKGSYAAVKGAMTVRDDIGESDTQIIQGTFADIINLTMIRNGYMNQPRPAIMAHRPHVIDVDRAQRDEALTRSGVRFKPIYFQRHYSLRKDEFEVTDPDSMRQSQGSTKKEDPTAVKNTPGGDKK